MVFRHLFAPFASSPRLASAIGAMLLASTLGVGCSRQQEGERCDSANNSADCADGLVCTKAASISAVSDHCCPTTGATGVCAGQSKSGLDSGIPDTGAAVDTGVASDSGATVDTGVASDSGATVDTGVASDSGAAVDAGSADGG